MKKKEFNTNETALLWRHDSQLLAYGVDMKNIYQRLDKLDISVDKILNNHLAHMQESIEEIREDISGIKSEISKNDPLTKLLWRGIEFILLGVIGAGIALIIKN